MAKPGDLCVVGLGVVCVCLPSLRFLPHALGFWGMGSAGYVSLTIYLMMFAGQTLWLTYGVVIGSASLILANVSALLLVGSVLLLKLRDRAAAVK